MKTEDLFNAVGEAEPALLARSEKAKKHRKTPVYWAGGLAACLAVVCVLGLYQPGNVERPPEVDPNVQSIISENGSDVGTFHLFQTAYAAELEQPPVDFALYINRDIYYTTEDNGTFTIRPIQSVSIPDLPEIRMDIIHLENTTVEEAEAALMEGWKALYADVQKNEEGSGPALYASNGNAWDDEQRDAWFVDDRRGGVFEITTSYFLEAAEGHGVRFGDMATTFRVVDSAALAASPEWVVELEDTVAAVSNAYFENDPADVEDLLTDDATFWTYGEDVSGEVSVRNIYYEVGSDNTIIDVDVVTEAYVSVPHRISTEDSLNYITMELVRENDEWRVSSAVLEK